MVQVQSTHKLDIIHNQPLAVIIVASLVVDHLLLINTADYLILVIKMEWNYLFQKGGELAGSPLVWHDNV